MPFDLKKNCINDFHNEILKRYENRRFLYFVGDEPISYAQYGEQVKDLRKKMAALGLKKADPVVILGQASPSWAISFMSIMSAGYVAVPIMEDFPATDTNHIINDSGAVAAFINDSYLKKDSLPALQNTLALSLEDFSVIHGQDLGIKREGRSEFTDDPAFLERVADDEGCYPTEPDDVAELLYTSGTTGHSKAVMLTHNNLVTNLYKGTDLIDDCFDEDSILLSLLPMAHSFGSTSAFLSTMYKGPRICFLKRKPTPEYLQTVFNSVKPTVLGGVPLIFEKIYQKKIAPVIEAKALLRWAVPRIPLVRKIFYRLAGKSVLKYFGGKIDCIIIGGANFSEQVEIFMREAKIPYLLGYGLSETSPLLTFSSLQDSRFGSVGHAVIDTDIRIIDQDENGTGDIEVRGPQVMKGYYKKPEETKAVFTEDGWFKTGDRGYFDSDGFLFIRGRSKNVIVGSSGENIYPEVIETLMSAHPLIEEGIVYMDEDQKLCALVYPDNELLTERSNSDKEKENGILEEIRTELNSKLPLNSRINRFIRQNEPFIKTPTRKIKRNLYIPSA